MQMGLGGTIPCIGLETSLGFPAGSPWLLEAALGAHHGQSGQCWCWVVVAALSSC